MTYGSVAPHIRYVATCYKRWAVAHTYAHRCRTPARILHAPGHAQTMRLCCFSVWWPLRQRQGGDAEAGWPIPAGPEPARPPATIPQAGLGGKRGVGFCPFLQGRPGTERAPATDGEGGRTEKGEPRGRSHVASLVSAIEIESSATPFVSEISPFFFWRTHTTSLSRPRTDTNGQTGTSQII